ncbi:MAG: aldehyde dehydrogenase [Acidimicrobiaceae bacterium]|nr:aldehyde dehydrogenase [Acidimicrobiaceae bacterium]MDE0517812.1 aldehyde dehydrogenase [Acidimicrobiaceae bacterium]MXZ95432.1 aldehyde dehydrogenase [Acidimicrobiaceae bacterium]MYF44727.1 aldehyde dehydrogenase [Acidimicrobiaceae bacterium]
MAESSRVVVGGVEVSVDHLIGGERLASARTFECRSSLDWQHQLADVSRGDAATAQQAVSAALDGFATWSGLPVGERAAALRRLADLIEARNDDIALVETLDMGFLHRSMRERLVARGALNFRFYADMAEAHDEPRWPARGTAHTVQRMPAGPAVVITPWNAPFMLATWKVAPALAAGNSVVLKPAEWSPLSASLLADLTAEAGLPPGAFNLVQGIGSEVGAALTADPRVRRISFTGSPETARHIGAAAAANIVPFTAELGGKGPLIVFADCDLEAAAEQAAAQYEDSGQVCLAGTRLLVEASILDDFQEALRVRTEAHVLGDSRDDSTTIAPMVHPDHLARVEGFVERARAAGDTVVWGGRRRAGSLHYELTLIEPASNDSEIVQREVFGPVLTIQAFSTEAEAVDLANSTRYGLSAIVYTGSADRAQRVGAAVRAGIVWTNTFLVRDLAAPFGGCGLSGIGREGGDHALDFHSDLKTLILADHTTT